MSDFIRTEHLSFSYDDGEGAAPIPALSDVNVTIQKGEYVAILGHNGSGKSTFAKLLNLILLPTAGKLFVDGVEVVPDGVSFFFGGAKRIRTAGLLVANEALYQLSHIPKNITYYILFFLLCQQFFACFLKK